MTINLEEYRAALEKTGSPHIMQVAESALGEAARVMSPQGLGNYLEGARALAELGRGAELVESYLQEMPLVVKELGEEVLKDCVTQAMVLSSMVSGEVIGLLFDSLPTAAKRLGDAELLRAYLGLIHQLSAKAPRGLRPMLGHLDELFGKLTLGGLRRWALWGAQAHGRDFAALTAYFNLESADAQAVLQQERRGVLFVDVQRKLNFYLRALWGRDFFLRPTSGDYENREGYKPFIDQRVIHLADAYDDYAEIPGLEVYRAAAAHAAAHLVYTTQPLSAEALTPVQMAFIGLFEDARVEALALRAFPGLKKLWLPLQQAYVREPISDPTVNRMARAALAMLDETYTDPDPWVQEAAQAFHQAFAQRGNDIQMSWDLGVTLMNKLGPSAALSSIKVLESLAIPYRDDNRYSWAFDEVVWANAEYVPMSHRQTRKTVTVMDMIDEVDCELAGDDAQEIWVLETEYFRDGDPEGVSINQLEGKVAVSQPFHYPEWDYQVQLHRPDWVTVLEQTQSKGDPKLVERILTEHKPIASRLRHIIDALQPRGMIRQRRQEDGDAIDLNAAIRAMIDLRNGETPDTRVFVRHIHKNRDLAVLVLLDLSESTNETLSGTDRPVLQLAREAATLLAWAIEGIGDPFAIHGFASDGRHDVQYYRYKDFDRGFDDTAKSRLAGMSGGLSTRMGAALRHGASHLLRQPQQKKLLLLVSDGEPADIDVRDPQYLRHDTKKAVEELAQKGIYSYCLTLDPQADDYVSRIFGPRGYTVVDHVQRLPEKLPTLFAALTQ